MTFENPVVIKNGGGPVELTMKIANMGEMFNGVGAGTLPEELILNLPNSTSLQNALRNMDGTGLKKLTITLTRANKNVVYYCSANNKDIEELNFPNGITTTGNVNGFLGYSTVQATKLKKVTGEIEIYGTPVLTDFCNAPLLEEIHFMPNCFRSHASFQNCKNLNVDSLVSIANALDSTVLNQELKLNSLDESDCNNTDGYIDGSGLFVIDPGGTMTLQYFIEQVKGWTLTFIVVN